MHVADWVDDDSHDALRKLEELARRTAEGFLRMHRPFDTHPEPTVGGSTAGRAGLLRLLGVPGGRSRDKKSFQGWRLHSMRMAETSIFPLTVSGDSDMHRNLTRKDAKDEEIWLGAKGELFVLVFRAVTENDVRSLAVSSRPLTYRSAARYDYTATWKTSQTFQGGLRVEEGWLEILGKPWSLEPFASVSKMLSSVSSGAQIPSAVS